MRSTGRGLLLFAAATLGLCGALAFGVARIEADLSRPLSFAGSRYAGSNECRQCHPVQHDSWHRTFHRTMTQEAGPQSVLGAFDGRRFAYGGTEAVMRRDERGRYVMDFSRGGGRERWSAIVKRTVGSRRYQQYLARDADVYYRLPIAWSVDEQRFIHMNGAFLTPDPDALLQDGRVERADYDRHVTRWNDNCVYCHNVAPRPGLDPETGAFETEVAELGIACEACHGPAARHAEGNRDPLRRFTLHLGGDPDPTIANPSRLSPKRGAEICGRCHGQRIAPDIQRVHRLGDRFLPGEELSTYSTPLARDTLQNGEPLFAARFWPDGTARLTAYEYQGLLQSACAQRGELQCTSCHGMHEGDPRGQLRPALAGDALCTQCHERFAGAALTQHTRHAAGSEGSRCVGCHMPKVVYGIVGAHRSHRIDSPVPALATEASRPDACTLCHVDRTRAWAARARADRAGDAGGETQVNETPEAARLLLAGDPIERALAAAALGSPEATAAGAAVPLRLGLLFDTLRSDAYPAVRAIAFRSVRALAAARQPGTPIPADAFDATASPGERARAVDALIARLPAAAVAEPGIDTHALRALQSPVQIAIGE